MVRFVPLVPPRPCASLSFDHGIGSPSQSGQKIVSEKDFSGKRKVN